MSRVARQGRASQDGELRSPQGRVYGVPAALLGTSSARDNRSVRDMLTRWTAVVAGVPFGLATSLPRQVSAITSAWERLVPSPVLVGPCEPGRRATEPPWTGLRRPGEHRRWNKTLGLPAW